MSNFSDFFGGGGGVTTWTSGMTVAQWQEVRSPADGERYVRKTAAGGGTTDPADDVTNYNASSWRRVSALATPTVANNGGSAGSIFTNAALSAFTAGAGTRALALSISGRGSLKFFGVVNNVGAARTRRIEVIVDGRTVLDFTASYANSGYYAILVGQPGQGQAGATLYPAFAALDSDLQFMRSLAIYITPTVADTGADCYIASRYSAEA